MDHRHETSAPPRPLIPPVTYLVLALVAGSLLMIGSAVDKRPPQPSAGQAFSSPSAGRTPAAARPAVRPLPPARPVRIRIPAIDVDAPMVELDLDGAGALQPPPEGRTNLAGWYAKGTAPGSSGTAVTTGHVDTRAGSPGVFYELGALTKNDTIEISRTDRRTAVFTIDAVEVYDKARFPNERVYGNSDLPGLRVITCGGRVDDAGYAGNIVVYATLTSVKQPNGRPL
jgi:hypothetical protein